MMIQIGASTKTIKRAEKAILKILSTGRGDDVTIKALDVLDGIASVNNATIQNCSFINKEVKAKKPKS